MSRYLLSLALAAMPPLAFPAPAQQANATADDAPTNEEAEGYPREVKPARHGAGQILVDARGHTLYMYAARVARGRNGDALKYCVGPCQTVWAPLAAKAGTKSVGAWSVVEGVEGPQWALRGNPVFTFRADAAPGATGGDGYDDLWSIVRFTPPAPKLAAPAAVRPAYVDSRYILTDTDGRPLYTLAGGCGADCTDRPLEAGLAARPVGDWSIDRAGDVARWLFRGKPVFVAADSALPPARAEMLRP